MNMLTAWTLLVLAGLFEVAFASTLKYTKGFSEPWSGTICALAAIASIWTLAQALQVIPLLLGYVVWCGVGTLGVVIVGIFIFGEKYSLVQYLCLCTIVASMICLKASSFIQK
jgi:quaternary ammonium compound-resistance protein SugE